MSKIFIFTASTGAGHNLAAQSLRQALMERNYEADVYDAFKESNAVLDRLMTEGYKQMVENTPKLYERLYYKSDRGIPFQQHIFSQVTKVMNPEIVPLIQSKKPDLIISTHPFVTQILGMLKAHGAFDMPVLAFVTDYKIHGIYIHKAINAYVVGSDYTKETMIEKGVSPDIVYPFGIPIRQEFEGKNTAHKAEKDPSVRGTVLLMAGSLGTKQMEKAFTALMKTEQKIRILVVCGNNEKVKRSIEFLAKVYYDEDKLVEVYGFVTTISELMDEADVIISKPGGLTSTEAIMKNIPMIIPYYYPGQEEENADYLVESGMAIKVEKLKDLTSMVDFLVENKYIIKQMSQNMSEAARKHSMNKTIDLCDTLIETYQEDLKKAATKTEEMAESTLQ